MHYVDSTGEGGTMLKAPDGGANPPIVAYVEDLQVRPTQLQQLGIILNWRHWCIQTRLSSLSSKTVG